MKLWLSLPLAGLDVVWNPVGLLFQPRVLLPILIVVAVIIVTVVLLRRRKK